MLFTKYPVTASVPVALPENETKFPAVPFTLNFQVKIVDSAGSSVTGIGFGGNGVATQLDGVIISCCGATS